MFYEYVIITVQIRNLLWSSCIFAYPPVSSSPMNDTHEKHKQKLKIKVLEKVLLKIDISAFFSPKLLKLLKLLSSIESDVLFRRW